MRAILSTLILVLVAAVGGPVVAQAATEDKLVDPSYQVPDLSGQVARLEERFLALAAHLAAMRESRDLEGVDARLEELFLPTKPDVFQRRYALELRLADAPDEVDSWRKLAAKYLRAGRVDDAEAAAFRVWQKSGKAEERAAALDLMAEAVLARGRAREAVNLYAKALALKKTGDRSRRFRSLVQRYDLRIKDVALDVEQSRPAACVVFSQKLARTVLRHPEDYAALLPVQDVDIHARDNQICFRGLKFGAKLELVVRPGVTGTEGGRLYREARRRFTVPDRAERISFDRNTYVLPRSADQKLPMTTVNLEAVKLRLYRIADRNLATAVLRGFIERNLYPSVETDIGQSVGSLVWEGEAKVQSTRNEEVTTLLSLDEALPAHREGIYALVARRPEEPASERWREHATQWLVVSDLGLTTFEGRNGLAVVVRALGDAAPVPGAELTLVARNNTVLTSATTDAQGIARFRPGHLRGKGGNRPALLTAATAAGDYNFIRLVGAELDLSERGVSGRAVPSSADAFLYADRGVYRPGETVRLSALLRGPTAMAMAELPLTVKVVRPGGTEMYAKTKTGDRLGGYGFDVPLSDAARAGTWTARAFLDPTKAAVGAVNFQVEDFVPLRIGATLASETAVVEAGEPVRLTLDGKFFYGAPAADLKVEARLTLAKSKAPYAGFDGFHFGLVQEEFRPRRRVLKASRTDAGGRARLGFTLDALPDTSHPLEAEIRASLLDVGGRPVNTVIRLPVRARAVEVGVRLAATGSLGPGDEATFEVVALDPEGQGVAKRRLAYRWVREHYDYSWYQHGGRWQTRVTVSDEVVSAGEMHLDDTGKGALFRPLAAGRYRFEVADADGTSAASQRFHVGWWAASRLPDVPDALELSLERADLAAGDTLKAFVRAPFAGTALVAVLSDRLQHISAMSLPEDGGEVTLPIDPAWGPGAYLMVTALRPNSGKPSLLPSRATGLAWFSIDRKRRTLGLEIETPESVLPRRPVTLPLRVTGAAAGEALRLTLAAVDEGILRLTNFPTPDPAGYYLAQRRLGVRIRDLYGRLVKARDGQLARLRSGGDARLQVAMDNVAGPKTRTVESVALYQRDIVVDEAGRAEITLSLPDFNGRLRLMAVAYGKEKIGAGEAGLVIRDDVVAEVILPRFLAPDDEAEATLSLHNLSDAPLTVKARLETEGGIVVGGAAPNSIQLAAKERRDEVFALLANTIGEGGLKLVVEAEGLERIERGWKIAVRPAWPRVTERQVTFLEPQQSLSGAGLATDAFLEADTTVTVAARPEFDAPALLADLRLYPYSCTEQTISRALPLIYAAELTEAWGKSTDELDIQRKVDRAIAKVLNRQRGDGAFAAWQAFGKRHPWLTAYTFDFLTQAHARGFDVPRAAYEHGQVWLKRFAARRGSNQLYAQAYALYVLARIGAVRASEVRYFADAYASRIRTRLGIGHVAAALATLGEREQAERLFEAAIQMRRPTGVAIHDYGSDLRDGAALAALLAEAATGAARRQRLAESLERRLDHTQYLSTQERVWLLLAARALSDSEARLQVKLDGETVGPLDVSVRRQLQAGDGDGIEVQNLGTAPIRVIETRRGVPSVAPPAVEEGFTLRRTYFGTDGGAVDLAAVRQHDQLVVLLEGEAKLLSNHEALIVDLLPAGFEIENAALGGAGGTGGFEFLPPLTKPKFEAARDDRYVAAVDLFGRKRKFALAYVVRAVTPGRFVLPGSFVEDMYKPRYHARMRASTVRIHQ